MSNNSCTINGSIYNKGKDKEKNVEISMPSGLNISLISSNYNSIKSENGRIIIDRVLPKQKVSIIALIEGITELDKKLKPEIKSEDANGKTYLTEDSVPPSMGWMIFSLSIAIFFVGTIAYTETQDTNTFTYVKNKYYEYKYSNLYEQGFKLEAYREHNLIDKFNINNNELPIAPLSVTEEDGYVDYAFEVVNPTNDQLKITIGFDTINSNEFRKKMKLLNIENKKESEKKKETLEELKKAFNEDSNKTILVYEDHNVNYVMMNNDDAGIGFPLPRDFEFKINPKEHKIININKKIKKGFTKEYFKMNIAITNENIEKEESLYLEFKPEESKNKAEFEKIMFKYNWFAQCTLCVKMNLPDCGKPQPHSTAIAQNPFVT
nr:hypothetical protein [Providencia stuartii]